MGSLVYLGLHDSSLLKRRCYIIEITFVQKQLLEEKIDQATILPLTLL